MPTVDRKNTDTDEKHSLSSFDKRKVQSVTFGARQQSRKKYRVVKHEYGSSAASDKDFRAPPEHEEKADKPATYTKAFVRPNNSKPSPHNRNAVKNCNNNSSAISPEMAQRMQRAAYIQHMNTNTH